jgi:hypothetical protein
MPTAESSELYAMTVTEGDPSWAGALAGISLNLPVYHIMEQAIRDQVPEETYQSELGVVQYSLDGDSLSEAVERVRNKAG